MERTVLGLRPGSVIQDSYRVIDLLGEGGMGATFAGENIATGHKVAIKVITPEFARQGKAGDLFRREANLMRSVQSDAVVGYETTLMDKEGQLYLVMEYIDGRPLSYFLDKGKKLSADDVLALGARLTRGLVAMHSMDIVHRDISPDNVMIPNGNIQNAKLIDLGVASDTVGTDKSIIGSSFAGKIKYAAPEQLGVGGSGAVVGSHSDLYSLGLVLLRAAGMKVPGADGTLADAIDARREDILLPSRTPQHLRETLEAILRANPSERPKDPQKLFRDALDASADEAIAPPHPEKKKSYPKVDDDSAEPASDAQAGTGVNAGLMVALFGLILALGLGWYFVLGPGSQSSGIANDRAEEIKEVLKKDDAFAEVDKYIQQGGSDNLDKAFGLLMAIARDADKSDADRGEASYRIARMYDPASYDPASSPFPSHNENAARRFYTDAAELGLSKARDALDQLGN